MDPLKILEIIGEKYSPLNSECQQELLESIKIISLDKGEVIVREGQYADKVYLIIKGAARAFYLNDGKDVSDWFAFENEFISSIISFFGKKPSPHFIETLEPSIVLELPRESIDHLSTKYHDFERLMRLVITEVMLSQQERLSSIVFHTAEQRYKHLLSIHPNLASRVPLMHIASYLGMTLETLSRVRRPKNRI